MKKLIIAFAMVAFGIQGYASNNPMHNPKQQLRSEIIALLEKRPNIDVENEYVEAHIVFTLNSKNEIVILTIEADKKLRNIDHYVKSRLNYRKVAFKSKPGDDLNLFEMDLKILKPEGAKA